MKMYQLCLLIILITSNTSFAAAPLQVSSSVSINERLFEFDLFVDKAADLSFAEILAKEADFKPHKAGPIKFDFPQGAYWGRFTIDNPEATEKDLYLMINPLIINRFDLYSPDDVGNYTSVSTGDHVPVNKQSLRHIHTDVKLSAKPGRTVFYFRLISGGSGADLPPTLTLFDEESHHWTMHKLTGLQSLILGFFLMMIAYNFAVWLRYKTKTYLFYVFYLLSWFFNLTMYSQIPAYYFFPDTAGGWLVDNYWLLTQSSICICACFFTRGFLNMEKELPKLSKLLVGFAFLAFILVPLDPYIGQYNLLSLIFNNIATPVMLVSGIIVGLRGFKPAFFYTLAWSFFLSGGMVWMAMMEGLLPVTFDLTLSPLVGTALECIFFGLALGKKMHLEALESKNNIEHLNIQLMQTMKEIKEKEEARTTFFNNTSHELRTPLSGMMGYLEMLQRGKRYEIEPQLMEVLGKIYRLSGGLGSLVDNILDVARSKRSGFKMIPESVDFQKVVDDLSLFVAEMKVSDPHLVFELVTSWQRGDDAFLVTDGRMVKTVLKKLVENAYNLRNKDSSTSIYVGFELGIDRLEIIIRDNGIGIADEHLGKIFDEFDQIELGSESYGLTGLSLNVVKSMLTAMNGNITVHSTVGEGNVFTVSLPDCASEVSSLLLTDNKGISSSSDQSKPAVSYSEQSTLFREGAGEHILVVDDHIANVETVTMLMVDYGYVVSSALNGYDALAILESGGIDLVLLDLMMPGMSGEEVLDGIRSTVEGQALPVIFLTARASEEDRLAGLRASADDYLAKPVNSRLLLEKVRNILDRVKKADELGKKSQLNKLKVIVEERTAELRAGKRKFERIMEHIGQGILIFDKKLNVDSEFSMYLSELYHVEKSHIVGKNVLDLIFKNSELSANEIVQISDQLTSAYGCGAENWLETKDILPGETMLKVGNTIKIVGFNWSPILSQSGIVESVMLVVQDLTEERELELKMTEQKSQKKKFVTIVSQIMNRKRSFLARFFMAAKIAVDSIEEELENNRCSLDLQRNLALIKEGAESLEATSIFDLIRLVESSSLERQIGSVENSEKFLELLNLLKKEIDEYMLILNHFLAQGEAPVEYSEYFNLATTVNQEIVSKLGVIGSKGIRLKSLDFEDNVVYWKPEVLPDITRMLTIAIENSIEQGYLSNNIPTTDFCDIELEVLLVRIKDLVQIEVRDCGHGFVLEKGSHIDGLQEGMDIRRFFAANSEDQDLGDDNDDPVNGLHLVNDLAIGLGGKVMIAANASKGLKLSIVLPSDIVLSAENTEKAVKYG